MRGFSALCAIAVLSFTAACAIPDVEKVQATLDTVKKVQNGAKQACAFVPTAETIAKLFSSSEKIDSVTSAISAVCTAISTVPLAEGPGKRVPIYNGVVIKGRYVRH